MLHRSILSHHFHRTSVFTPDHQTTLKPQPFKMSAPSIALDEVEQTLRKLLLDVVDFIDKNPLPETQDSQVNVPRELAKAPLELRWTGGWVRDKLLKVGSKDIDVAINKMTGYQFGMRMKEYLEIEGNEDKYVLPNLKGKSTAR